MVTGYWSADNLFWRVSVDRNMYVQQHKILCTPGAVFGEVLFFRILSISDVRGQAFFWPASRTVGFSPWFKTFGHMITFLRRCCLQNTDLVMPFWLFLRPLKVDCLSHLFPAFVKVQWKERCPSYNLRSFKKRVLLETDIVLALLETDIVPILSSLPSLDWVGWMVFVLRQNWQ